AYKQNTGKEYAGLQAVVIAGHASQVCPDVNLQFDRIKLEDGKLVKDNSADRPTMDNSADRPTMLRVQVSHDDIQLVKIYAK
ncbi:MAG: hypothetical protein SOX97_08990, partial [Sutterella sp.]|nr:hypothetical protein [Sutterella sp.]